MRCFTALLFSTFLAGPAIAQMLPFDYYTTENGLPSNWVTSLFQDSRSYLWIGGDGGLAVYDGMTFKTYSVDDGLPVGHVWCFAESRKTPGTMWIGTHGGGLSKLQAGKISSIPLGDRFEQNVITSVIEDAAGVVWCGTLGGLFQVRGDRISHFRTGKDSSWIAFVEQTLDSLIWIGTARNLFTYSLHTGAMQRIDAGTKGAELRCLIEDEDGTVWLGTEDGMIRHLVNNRVVASNKLPFGEILSGLDDQEGNLWFTTNSGIIKISKRRFDRGEYVRYTFRNGLPENNLDPCLIDREGNLWFGSHRKGLCKLSIRNLYTYPLLQNTEPHATVAVRDHLFVTSDKGLLEIWRRSDGSWQNHLHLLEQKTGAGKPYLLDIGPDGVFWLAYRRGGLTGYRIIPHEQQASDLKPVKTLTAGKELPEGDVAAFIVDRNNQLWYSLRIAKGLALFDLEAMKMRRHFSSYDGMPASTVVTMCQDGMGRIWLGTFNDGVVVLKQEEGRYAVDRRITVKDGLAGNRVRSILHRRSDEVWMGTRFHGITIYHDGNFENVTSEDGLINNAVWALAEDDEERVWIGTSTGIQRTGTAEFGRFSTPAGLAGKHTSVIGFIGGQQVVWAIASQELTIYDYGRKRKDIAPPVYITGFRVNGAARPVADGMEFSYSENFFVVQFSGISFKGERSLQYKYRLLGLDHQWQEPTDQRAVTYASLHPGSYVFEVKAINPDGVESAAPATLAFTILPPFWLRPWFVALGIFIMSGFLYFMHRLRLRRAVEIEKIRSRIATDLHDDIGAGLTHIGLLSEVALRKSGMRAGGNGDASADETESHATMTSSRAVHELSRAVERAGAISRELTATMSDVVWSISPKHDSVEALQRRLTAFAHEICAAKNMDLHFEVSERIAKFKLHPEIRRNLLLIAKEALHNMAKYSGSSEVTVRIDCDGRRIHVLVEDRGKGFAMNAAKNGNGLANMRLRAEKLGGTCEIVSESGKGTRVTAKVPYKK